MFTVLVGLQVVDGQNNLSSTFLEQEDITSCPPWFRQGLIDS